MLASWHPTANLAPPAQACAATVPGATFNFTSEAALSEACAGLSLGLFSARFDGKVTAPAGAGTMQFAIKTNGAVRMWVDDHILVDTSCNACNPPGGGIC